MNLEAMLEPANSSENVTKIQPPYNRAIGQESNFMRFTWSFIKCFSSLCVYLYTLVGITMYLIRPLHQEEQVAKICKEKKY